MNKKKFMLRVFFYASGLFLVALGAVVSVNSNLGVSPVSSLPYVASVVSNINLGVCFTVIFAGYIIIQIVTLRKDFKWINLTQIAVSGMFGYFVELARVLAGDFVIPTYHGRLLMILISTVLIGTGVVMYVGARLVPMPSEGMANAFAQKWGRPFYQMKIAVDCSIVAGAVILSLMAFGTIYGVREGTVICAVLIGWVVKRVQKVLKPVMERLAE